MKGSVVQLVRMPPCHGGGRGFESRPVRIAKSLLEGLFFCKKIMKIIMSWYIYILKSELDGDYYKGITENVTKRLEEHNTGQSKYTSTKMPWQLVYSKEMESKKQAIIEEKRIKKLNRKSLEKIIES